MNSKNTKHTIKSKASSKSRHSDCKVPELQTLKAWRQSADKDNQGHYESPLFQQLYDQHEMPKRTKDTRKWLSEPVKYLLKHRQEGSRLRLLSLGCGPGSDLLAGVKSLLQHREALASVASIACTGVDLLPWKRASYYSELRLLCKSDPICPRIDSDFRVEDLQEFVLKCCLLLVHLHNTGKSVEKAQFDLITMSYANAKETLNEIAKLLPWMLRPGGCIVIIDNNTEKLRDTVRAVPEYKTVFMNHVKLVLAYPAEAAGSG